MAKRNTDVLVQENKTKDKKNFIFCKMREERSQTWPNISWRLTQERQATDVFYLMKKERCAVWHKENLHSIFQSLAGLNMMRTRFGRASWESQLRR